jgi:hypothetical protein
MGDGSIVSAHVPAGGKQPPPYMDARDLSACGGDPFAPIVFSLEDRAIMNSTAHDFGIVLVYTTLAEQKRQLQAADFKIGQALDNVVGRPLANGADIRAIWWFQYIAKA